MHPGSKGTFEFISEWMAPDFYHSRKDGWERMGALGTFGDMILTCLPIGSIVEIGCGESSIYLSHLARKFNRRIFHCDIAHDKIINPLTVPGYMYPEELSISERNRLYNYKNSSFFMGSSNDLFNKHLEGVSLALTFIDGDHVYAQAKKDFENAMDRTIDDGYVILHDTYPPSEKFLSPDSACGDVYRLRQEIEADKRYDSLTLVRGVAMDVGLTIVRKKSATRAYFQE